MITKKDILNDLKVFEKAVGKPVIVHSSLKAVGQIEGGAQTLLSALIEFFTRDGGLLCIPSHTWLTRTLDLNKAESCIGVLPTVACAHKDAVRSIHPTHSMVVFGDTAEAFVKNEEFVDSPTSPEGCHGNIFKMDGYVLLLGVKHDKNTYLHCVEEMLIPSVRIPLEVYGTIIRKDGRQEQRKLRWFDTSKIPDVSVYFPKFEPAFRRYDAITDGKVGNADVQLCSARIMKDVVEKIYKNAQGQELLSNHTPLSESLYL